jgi:hypothetical protein
MELLDGFGVSHLHGAFSLLDIGLFVGDVLNLDVLVEEIHFSTVDCHGGLSLGRSGVLHGHLLLSVWWGHTRCITRS